MDDPRAGNEHLPALFLRRYMPNQDNNTQQDERDYSLQQPEAIGDTSQALALPLDGRGEPPPHVKVLRNGAWYDTQRNRIVANPPGGPSTGIKTQSQGVALATRRRQLAQEAAQAAIAEYGKAPGDLYGGWRTIVRAQTGLALDVDKGRSSTEAARFVGSAAGFLSEVGRAGEAEYAPLDGVYLGPEMAKALVGAIGAIMRSLSGGNDSVVIDG